jgi:hypothetical protein
VQALLPSWCVLTSGVVPCVTCCPLPCCTGRSTIPFCDTSAGGTGQRRTSAADSPAAAAGAGEEGDEDWEDDPADGQDAAAAAAGGTPSTPEAAAGLPQEAFSVPARVKRDIMAVSCAKVTPTGTPGGGGRCMGKQQAGVHSLACEYATPE